jgi:hypothetical protein
VTEVRRELHDPGRRTEQ